jgi:3',5'-nucleoside bisphosphate phosphatase
VPVDLHTHSRVSDGSDDPEDLVGSAARIGLSAIALTDHDTLEGIERARVAAEVHGIELVPGAEISCGGSLHMLVLFLEPRPGPLQDRLAWIQTGREERNAEIIVRLNRLGIPLTLEEVLDEAGTGVVGRPHIAARIVAHGFAESIPDAFARWLGTGRPGYIPRRTLDPIEATRLSRAAGAVPVVAHPHTIDPEFGPQLERRLESLADAGLVGVEVFYSGYEDDRRRRLQRMADRLGLRPSGGSDYHGSYKAGISLGVGDGSLSVPVSVLEDLREAAG